MLFPPVFTEREGNRHKPDRGLELSLLMALAPVAIATAHAHGRSSAVEMKAPRINRGARAAFVRNFRT
jgi:hypothetical protein